MKKIRKAVIPVAGLGTRFLPATKSMPKEMLPVVDRPVVQYAVDEAFEAGIEHIVFVTGRNKAVIEDYFDLHPELIGTLEQTGKKDAAAVARKPACRWPAPPASSASSRRKALAMPSGARARSSATSPSPCCCPTWCPLAGAGAWPKSSTSMSNRRQCIAVERCDPSETNKYGIVGRGADIGGGFEVTAMVEKPAPANAPSNFYINGRYILQPEIFALLGNQQRGAGNEIQLTDAMVRLSQDQPFFAQPFKGRMFDCGSKEGFIQANIAFALARDDMKGPVFEMLQEFVRSHERQEEAA